jgi:hypothetical protein
LRLCRRLHLHDHASYFLVVIGTLAVGRRDGMKNRHPSNASSYAEGDAYCPTSAIKAVASNGFVTTARTPR